MVLGPSGSRTAPWRPWTWPCRKSGSVGTCHGSPMVPCLTLKLYLDWWVFLSQQILKCKSTSFIFKPDRWSSDGQSQVCAGFCTMFLGLWNWLYLTNYSWIPTARLSRSIYHQHISTWPETIQLIEPFLVKSIDMDLLILQSLIE